MTFQRVVVTAVVLVIYLSCQAYADKRVALVIGNSAYEHVARLGNTANDAADIASAFEKLDFTVRRVENLGRAAMIEALAAFSDEASRADIAAVYYAGHGMEVDKQNYLIPVDAKLEVDRRIRFEAIPLDEVMAAVDGARRLKLVLLDACRNNPFANRMKTAGGTRAIGRGLSRVEPTTGTLVGFAAKEGTVADDGTDRNSPYAKALLANLGTPGLEINLLFRKVRDEVIAATGGKQEPFTYGSLPGDQIFLVEAPAQDQQEASSLAPAAVPSQEMEIVFWNTVKDSKDAALLQSYLDRFPDGVFSGLAKVMIGRLAPAPVAKGDERRPVRLAAAAPTQEPKPATTEEILALGRRYESGDGVKRDPAEAAKLYRQAAERSNPEAMFRLGLLYYRGEGVARSPTEAAIQMLEAVRGRHQPALTALTADETLRDADFVEVLQNRLGALGLYRGSIDGKWGAWTRDAILAHGGEIAVAPERRNEPSRPADQPRTTTPARKPARTAECDEARRHCRLQPFLTPCSHGGRLRTLLDTVCAEKPAAVPTVTPKTSGAVIPGSGRSATCTDKRRFHGLC